MVVLHAGSDPGQGFIQDFSLWVSGGLGGACFVESLDIYRRLQGNQNSSAVQCEVAYQPALAVGSAVQFAAAYCPNERTFDAHSADRQTHLWASRPHYMAFTPKCYAAMIIIMIMVITIS